MGLVVTQKGENLIVTIDSSKSINVTYECTIQNNNKFVVRLIHSPDQQLMRSHDMDDGNGRYYIFPYQYFLNEFKQRKVALNKMERDDLECVIDTLFIHPTPHQHIESLIDNHDIRIGGGITNPFLYLFHLRIQQSQYLREGMMKDNGFLIFLKMQSTKNTQICRYLT